MAASHAAPDNQRRAMPPPAPRAPASKRRVVLEEDTFAEAIEAIVERDFFPALPKLQNQLEWLQAVQSGDPAQLKRAQLNIARRRAGLRTPLAHEGPAATPAITPGTGLLRTPAMTPAVAGPPGAATPTGFGGAATPAAAAAGAATPGRTPAAGAAGGAAAAALDPVAAQQAAGAKAPALGLDQFFSVYQGEDNASFQALQAKAIARKRAKMAHHLTDKNAPLLLEAGGHASDEYGTSGQAPSSLIMTKHVPKSALYYDTSQRPALALTAAEAATVVAGPPKTISHAATRSLTQTQDVPAAAGDPAAAAAAAAAAAGAGGKLAAAAVAPGTRGYGYMRTPQLLPGVEASPLMTWGDIASTPLRLDGAEPVAGGAAADLLNLAELEELVAGAEAEPGGRQFSMPEVRSREVAARAMVAGRGAAAAAGRRRMGSSGGGSGTPLLDSLRRGGATPGAGGTPGLSAAGLKLAQQLKRPGSSVRGAGSAGGGAAAGAADLQLRASYKGGVTPSRGASGPGRWANTPGSATPGLRATPAAGGVAAAVAGSQRRQQGGGGSSSSIRVQQKQAAAAGGGGGGGGTQQAAAAGQQQQQQAPVAGSITDDLLKLG